jgi:hypothetical protein
VPPLPPSRPPRPQGDVGSETCPGCGAVLAVLPDAVAGHPGASASCSRLFDVTVQGLRDEAQAAPSAAPLVRLAEAAYDAQHPVTGDLARLDAALSRLADMLGTRPTVARPSSDASPPVWRTTVADAAADLDVIDLPVLLDSWARSVQEDWARLVHAH